MIATDDATIAAVVKDFGAEVVMTDPHHLTGTDRLAEVAERYLHNSDLIVNIQGDEPECEPADIDRLIRLYQATECAMATLVCRFPAHKTQGPGSPADPNCVKAVLGRPIVDANTQDILGHEALYFSRSVIPYPRDTGERSQQCSDYFMHCGLYAYSPQFLQQYVRLPQGQCEKIEKLEQLRIVENGYKIVAGTVARAAPGIDTAADYEAFVQRWQHQHQKAVMV